MPDTFKKNRWPSGSCCRCLLILLSFTVAGCYSDQYATYPVTGKVEFDDGSHPMFGDIEFYNEANRINARGKINRDGTFTVGTYTNDDGAVQGKHEVIIIQRTRNHLAAQVENEIVHDHGDLIHRKYFDYRQSDLVVQIAPVENNQLTLVVDRATKRQAKDAD